jgi:DNA-binding response OmpR family regulator
MIKPKLHKCQFVNKTVYLDKGAVKMSETYISIEKNDEGFKYYKSLWEHRGITGIRVDTIIECIEEATAIKRSKSSSLLFIAIVADDIKYMPQLSILAEEINVPILIATSNYNEDEHHKALNTGACFYGSYCDDPEKNINAVLAAVNSFNRAKRKKTASNVLIHGGVMISLSQRKAFVNDVNVELSRQEFDVLRLFMKNRGKVLSYKKIYQDVWGKKYEANSTNNMVRSAIKRLRKKVVGDGEENSLIANIRGTGYKMSFN